MQAFDVALKIYRRPSLVRAERRKPLPLDILPLIRIASGSEVAPEFLTTERAKSELEAREASVFFLQQVLLSSKSDAYRQLGLTSHATPEQINEHKRYMLKWLHPDRNRNKWESALFQRVANAAGTLEKGPAQPEATGDRPVNREAVIHTSQRKLSRYQVQLKPKKNGIAKRIYLKLIFIIAFVLALLLFWKFYSDRMFNWFESQLITNGPNLRAEAEQITIWKLS
jgi:hypothetical protein